MGKATPHTGRGSAECYCTGLRSGAPPSGRRWRGRAGAQTPIPPLTFLSSSAGVGCRHFLLLPLPLLSTTLRHHLLPPPPSAAADRPCRPTLLRPPPASAAPRCCHPPLLLHPAAAATRCCCPWLRPLKASAAGTSRRCVQLSPPPAAASPTTQVPRHKRLWPLEFDLSAQNVELLHEHRCSESMFSSTQCVRQGVTGSQAPKALKFRTPIRWCCRVHFLSLSGVSEAMNIISVIILVHLYCEVRLQLLLVPLSTHKTSRPCVSQHRAESDCDTHDLLYF